MRNRNSLTMLALLTVLALGIGISGCGQDRSPVAPLGALSGVSVGGINGQPDSTCTALLAGQDIVLDIREARILAEACL